MIAAAANDNSLLTAAEIRAARAENRRKMKGASPEMRALCEELEAIYAVMAYREKHGWPEVPK